MNAKQIFDTALVLMFGEQADAEDYQPFWLNTLNWMIAENFKKNNAMRVMRGKEELKEPQLVGNMDEEVEMEYEFTRYILPMGCAGYIYTDDSRGVGSAYKDKYEYERSQVTEAVFEDV